MHWWTSLKAEGGDVVAGDGSYLGNILYDSSSNYDAFSIVLFCIFFCIKTGPRVHKSEFFETQ